MMKQNGYINYEVIFVYKDMYIDIIEQINIYKNIIKFILVKENDKRVCVKVER